MKSIEDMAAQTMPNILRSYCNVSNKHQFAVYRDGVFQFRKIHSGYVQPIAKWRVKYWKVRQIVTQNFIYEAGN